MIESESDSQELLLRTGQTCWRIERANRFALIVDAAEYFRTVKSAILKARRTVMLIGWDFDTRIELEPGNPNPEGPNRLGRFMSWAARQKPDVQFHVLQWDVGLVHSVGRGATPLFILDWMSGRNIHFKLDGTHPRGAAHHQKIVVIDDVVAFCGGIDMMTERWDTRAHPDSDARRTDPGGGQHGPWHDATTLVDGNVAKALGDLARARWRRATGEVLEPPPADVDTWPDGLAPMIEDVDVAIARTIPEEATDRGKQREVVEVESLYLTALAAARRTIYIETQYFASRRIAEAIARRLRDEDGPEIVIVHPESADGWLESKTMDSARARLLKLLRDADAHSRFRIFHPVTASGQPIYVHAKIMVIDDRLLKVGSSNLNNRSMGFDTECDLAMEAVPGTPDEARLRAFITSVRDDLLAEHLGVSADEIAAAFERRAGSIIRAIETARRPGRTLEPFRPRPLSAFEEALAENDLFDPERPPDFWQELKRRRRPWR